MIADWAERTLLKAPPGMIYSFAISPDQQQLAYLNGQVVTEFIRLSDY